MKKGDFIWGGILLIWIVVLIVPTSQQAFITITSNHAYLGGFFKFCILASMGDLLGNRVITGQWKFPKGFIAKACIWGIIGMMITLMFTLYSNGVLAAQKMGKLPFYEVGLAHAFFTSVIMNLTFAPAMFMFHKFADSYVDMKYESKKVTIKALVERIDWYTLINFSFVKTIPLFWIPCHTIVFLLPEVYRVLASAFLSIALGLLLAIAKKGTITNKASMAN